MRHAVLSHFSHIELFATPWTVAPQAPLSMGFSRQEYWSGLPCPPPGDLPDIGIEVSSLRSPALAGRFFTTSTPREWMCTKSWHITSIYNGKYRKQPKCSIGHLIVRYPVIFKCYRELFVDIEICSFHRHREQAVDTAGEGEGGMNWKSNMETYTLPHVN